MEASSQFSNTIESDCPLLTFFAIRTGLTKLTVVYKKYEKIELSKNALSRCFWILVQVQV